jgi:hypothetical protein
MSQNKKQKKAKDDSMKEYQGVVERMMSLEHLTDHGPCGLITEKWRE